MTLPEITTGTIIAASTALVTVAAAVEGWDAATITIVGAVICTIITALSVAIVKVLGALQEMKVKLIEAADHQAEVIKKTVENATKLQTIGEQTDGQMTGLNKRLDEALRRIDEMQKAAVATAAAAPPYAPAPVATPPVPSSPDPLKMELVNTEANPAKVDQITKS